MDNLYAINNSNIAGNFNEFSEVKNVNTKNYLDPFELYDIFKDSINHILFSKPFFDNMKNILLKKLEFNYLKNDLSKKGVNTDIILEGCLDCIKDCI